MFEIAQQDDNFISDFYVLYPEEITVAEGQTVEIRFDVEPASLEEVVVYRTKSGSSAWTKVDSDVKGGVASFQTSEGGVYVAVGYKKGGMVAGAVIGALIGVALIAVASFCYFRKNPDSLSGVKRSFAARV
jgi:hypothetical protein